MSNFSYRESESVDRLKDLYNRKVPVALTAPLQLKDSALIGFYEAGEAAGSVRVPLTALPRIAAELYVPTDSRIIAHGLKKIWQAFVPGEIDVKASLIEDTRLLGYLLDPDRADDQLTLSHLVHEYGVTEYPHRGVDIGRRNVDALRAAVADDARMIFDLSRQLTAEMPPGMQRVYRRTELPLMPLLENMRRTGIGVDQVGCATADSHVQERIEALQDEITDGMDVNLQSDRQTFRFLLEQGVRFTPGTSPKYPDRFSEELREAALENPLAAKVLEWRGLRTDWEFLKLGSQTDRLHPTWGQTRAGTSRIYARNPAVQNVSRHLRRYFVPAPRYVYVKADYSQAQLRILAYLTKDGALRRLYADPEGDAHTATSARLGLGDRDIAKEINFAICYGMSAGRLADRINAVGRSQGLPSINELTAQSYIDGFYDTYPGIRDFFDREWAALKKLPLKERVVTSPFGRIRRFDKRISNALQRQFRVTLPQMLEADLIKTAMVRLDRLFRRRDMGARIVMVIHDSIWIDAPIGEEAEVGRIMERMMSAAGRPLLDMKVDFED